MEYIKYTPELSNNWSRAQNHIAKHNPDSMSRIVDSMTVSQMQSKLWLGTELQKLDRKFNNVAVIGGWYCHILAEILISNLDSGFVCNYDIDKEVQVISYKFNKRHKDANKFKSNRKNLFVNKLDSDQKDRGSIDLLINPSCEHMWHMSNIRDIHFSDPEEAPIFALQSTDEEKYDDHINCVSDPEELAEQARLTTVYYSGTKVLDNGMKRFMVIGR